MQGKDCCSSMAQLCDSRAASKGAELHWQGKVGKVVRHLTTPYLFKLVWLALLFLNLPFSQKCKLSEARGIFLVFAFCLNRRGFMDWMCLIKMHTLYSCLWLLNAPLKPLEKGFMYLTFLWGMNYRKGKAKPARHWRSYKLRAIFSFLM